MLPLRAVRRRHSWTNDVESFDQGMAPPAPTAWLLDPWRSRAEFALSATQRNWGKPCCARRGKAVALELVRGHRLLKKVGLGMSSDAHPLPRTSTANRLIEVAEKLFAVHGLDGVSLRQIAVDAGTTNNSAVRYHFGSKAALITAIIEYRLPDIIERRQLLQARSDPDDLRSVLEAHLLPVVDLAERTDNYYLIFVEQLQRYGRGDDHPFLNVSAPLRDSHRMFFDTAGALLGHVPEALRADRIGTVNALCLHVSADRQRGLRFGAPQRPYALHVNDLFDGLVGFLSAPASRPTQRALKSSREDR